MAQTAQTDQTVLDIDFTLSNRLFRISAAGLNAPAYEMPATYWLEPNKALEALKVGGVMSKAIGLKLPVSYAGLSVINLVIAQLLFLARYDHWLDLPLDHLTFQMEEKHGYMQTGYRIHTLSRLDLPRRDDQRKTILEHKWRQFIQRHVRPAVEAIANAAGHKPDMIWNQAGGRLAAIRDYVRKNETAADDDFLERFDWHADILSRGLAPSDFARKRNPFCWLPRYTDNPWQPGGYMIIRSSCCMFDCRQGGQKCYNCPRLTKEERDIRRAAVLADAAT